MKAEQAASDRLNREGLFSLLQATEDSMIELYGIWYGDFAKAPEVHEAISVETILDPGFRFKEGGFYKVCMDLHTQISLVSAQNARQVLPLGRGLGHAVRILPPSSHDFFSFPNLSDHFPQVPKK